MNHFSFPDPADGPGDLPLAQGGDLSPDTLLQAYSLGIFQWYSEDTPILWWSPDPRAILPLDGFHLSRRLARTMRQGKFTTTTNQAFAEVVAGCAEDRADGNWILPEVHEAYCNLHRQGNAHSVEVWSKGKLAGGLFGVSLGGFFSAESMFYRVSNASKVALACLVERLKEKNFQLLDVQILNDHTASLGAVNIPRMKYLRLLRKALKIKTTFK